MTSIKMTGGSGVGEATDQQALFMATGERSCALALNTPRLPRLPPPPAPPAARCLKRGSSPGISFSPRRWISLRPSTSSGPNFRTPRTPVSASRLTTLPLWTTSFLGKAAAIKGIPTPAPPLAPMSDDMQGECFRTLSSSRRVTQCPLFPPVQHLFTAAGGDPSTLKAPVSAFTDFTNVEGWTDTQARGIPRLEPSLAALLCPGAGWRCPPTASRLPA
ncbi:unnamed protein product [Boreogadus saida]